MKSITGNTFLVPWILALAGFTAVVAQIMLMRELIVVFQGNELSLGVMLAGWLLWTALGSGLMGRVTGTTVRPDRVVAILQTGLALALPVTIMAVRGAGRVFGAAPGELLGPGPMLVTSFVAVSLFCLLSGALFAACSRLHVCCFDSSVTKATGRVYLMEAIGAGVGGLFAGLAVAGQVAPFEIVFTVALINLEIAVMLAIKRAPIRAVAVLGLLVVFVSVVIPRGGRLLENVSLDYQWSGFRLEDTRYSVYGSIAVTSSESGRTFYQNGVPLFTWPDPEAAEEEVHLALLQHPAPQRVLVIGGGAGGALEEALKHPSIKRIDYAELDPEILALAERYNTGNWLELKKDPRVEIQNEIDGRLFLKSTTREYDVIIVNLPDPSNAVFNRFFTVEFFGEALRRLTPDGLLSFQVSGAANYYSDDLADFLRCVKHTLGRVFTTVVVFPGGTVHFFAAGAGGTLTENADLLIERLRERGIDALYIREYYLPFRLSPDRMADFSATIKPLSGTPVNSDFAPVAYYFNNVLWSTRYHRGCRDVFRTAGGLDFIYVILVLGVVLAVCTVLVLIRYRGGRLVRVGAGWCVVAMGFTVMGLQVMLLLAFQAVYGYVYQQLSVLVAAVMAGMALGCWLAIRQSNRLDLHGCGRMLFVTQAVATGLPVISVVSFMLAASLVAPAAVAIVANFLFTAIAVVSGGLGGFQFPVASRLFFNSGVSTVKSPGAVYALDITGACLGALLISVYLLPVFGFLNTAIVLALVNAAPAIVARLTNR